jgi:hypothetical protein
MGRTVSVYLTDEALEKLNSLTVLRKTLWGDGANQSNTLSDFINQHAREYAAILNEMEAAAEKYIAGEFAPGGVGDE